MVAEQILLNKSYSATQNKLLCEPWWIDASRRGGRQLVDKSIGLIYEYSRALFYQAKSPDRLTSGASIVWGCRVRYMEFEEDYM